MSFYKLPESLDSEIKEYESLVREYKSDKLAAVKLKAFRVPFGVYEQREPKTYMCRIRLPGGAITQEQLAGVAGISEKYSDRPLHFTTRQEVQIHHVTLEKTVFIIKELKELGLSTRGGGGNTVRNILGDGSPEVEPYLQALTSRLIAEKDSWNLPRKLKIAFSGDASDRGLATCNDLGFIFKIKNGTKGFSVYVAGGMGAKPQVAEKLTDFVAADQVYNIAKTVKNLFDKYGNRKNKHAARLRFLFNKLGRDEFFKRWEEELAAVKKENYPPLAIDDLPAQTESWQEIPLFLGDLEIAKAKQLAKACKAIRATPNQNLKVITNSRIDLESFDQIIGRAVACTGANTCRLGICLSRNLLSAIKDKNLGSSDKIDDMKINVSGCPNACGHHHIADIGFFGVAKRFDNHLVPCYTVVMGGVVYEGRTRLAEKIGILPAKAIPDFVAEYLEHVSSERLEKESFFDYFVRQGKDEAVKLIEKYSPIPSFSANKDFYYDFGDDKLFSVAAKTEGECSAGMYDLIDWDFENIKTAFAQNDLRQAVLSASRALLVTKGFEPKSEAEAVVLFKQHFIGKHLDVALGEIIDKYLNNQEISLAEANKLADAVKALYDSMDNSLKFPEVEKANEIKGSQSRDFRGVLCPMNFVKTKLVLETMQPGEKLEILLDDGEPIDNVPASLKAEGHMVVKQEKIDNYWRVVIECVREIHGNE